MRSTLAVRSLVCFLCIILVQSALPLEVRAWGDKNNKDRVQIQIGVPSVWSIGQAHYLLAKMHKDNRMLETSMPDKTALDPNGIDATKIRLLRTLLDAEAQLNEKVGTENRAELREQDFKLRQREEAQVKLQEKQEELDNIDDELTRMSRRLARWQADASQREAERNAQAKPNETPPLPAPQPDESEKELQRDIKELEKKVERKQAERTKIAAEIAELKPIANGAVAKPALSEVQFTSTASLPERAEFVEQLARNAANNLKQPKLAASIALDNFIGMQYEIIAKQLTLLRDEAGPDNRVIFLELPSSIYTVPCKGDNYLAQVQWKITRYFQEEESQEDYNSKKNYNAVRSGKTSETETHIKGTWETATPSTVRALDIIPRQSALNVNEVQSTVSRKNFLGIIKLLMGFGIRVNYQRQEELYEQYLKQEVFGAGFGKGSNTFGWTFGPLPGTNRLAPGVRTTYAVLSVPKNTSLIEVETAGVAYRREEAPNYADDRQKIPTESFKVLIPNTGTEQFMVNEVWYTPVKRGETVTVLLKGTYFSPQAGILIDGVPLAKSLSLGNTATSDAGTDNSAASGARGQFELASSRELIMKFSMNNDKYVGTPDITIVTPEKARTINAFKMDRINNLPDVKLRDLTATQPMFFEDFSLEEKLTLISKKSDDYIMARLKGSGLRPDADVWVDNKKITHKSLSNPRAEAEANPAREFTAQVDTGEYFLYFKNPGKDLAAWSIRFRQPTVRGFNAVGFDHKFTKDEPAPPDYRVEVRGYSPSAVRKTARLDVRIISDKPNSEMPVVGAELSPRTDGKRVGNITYEGTNSKNQSLYRVVFDLNFEAQGKNLVEKSQVSITITRKENPKTPNEKATLEVTTHDKTLTVRPKAETIYISPALSAQEGGAVITIEGINLHLVDKVLIGDKESEIVSNSETDKLVVKLKNGVFVKAETGVQIPLVLVAKDGTKIPAVVTVGKNDADQKEKQDRHRRVSYSSRGKLVY